MVLDEQSGEKLILASALVETIAEKAKRTLTVAATHAAVQSCWADATCRRSTTITRVMANKRAGFATAAGSISPGAWWRPISSRSTRHRHGAPGAGVRRSRLRRAAGRADAVSTREKVRS